MYQIIYDFISNDLIGALNINDIYIENLKLILTHTSLILIYIVLIMLVVGCFKVMKGILHL